MQVEIRLNNSWVDVSNYVVGAITIDRRVDEVLDSGAFTFVSKEINYNIPPLTICIVDGEIWLCSSECNEVIPSNPKEYNHNVTLIELTYYLQCYIVGTKAMSNTGTMYPTNKDKCEALVDFINNKYSLIFGDKANQFKFDTNAFNDSRWELEREFMFGSGTTLFQALLEIGKTCNAIPRLKGGSASITGGDIYIIYWDLLDNNSEFKINNTKVLTRKYNQNVDEYTAILESEVNDVVDRTTTSSVYGLSVRSESYVINDDNQVLITPSRIESVKKFEVNIGTIEYKYVFYDCSKYFNSDKAWDDFNTGTITAIRQPFSKWKTYFYDQSLTSIYYDILTILNGNDYETRFYKSGATADPDYFYDKDCLIVEQVFTAYDVKIDLTDKILEKTRYDLLEALEKTKYCYYTYNDNVIRGIYEYIHDDFWGFIMREKRYPFLYYFFNEQNSSLFDPKYIRDSNNYLYYKGIYPATEIKSYSINPKDYTFNLEYTPITSTFIISNNDKKPFNEESNKLVSRSFQLADSMSDFDLLVNSINKNNNMMGLPEVSISYYGNNYPKPRDLIKIKNKNYYVSSVQTTILLGQYTSVINLVKEYNKIAEVFGVKTQYESTRLPLNNIIDRIVYCGGYQGNLDYDGIVIVKEDNSYIFKYGSILSYNNNTYIVVEAKDNYCFDTQNVANDNLENGTENKEISYANNYNEQVEYNIKLAKLNEFLTLENCKALPEVRQVFLKMQEDINPIKVYKDARERLIFVFKYNKV